MSGIETGKTYHHQAWCKMLTRTWTAVACNCGAMTTPGADQAEANAFAEEWRSTTLDPSIHIHVAIGGLVNLARAYLALLQENAELRRALEDERAARRASVNVAVKTKLGSGRKP